MRVWTRPIGRRRGAAAALSAMFGLAVLAGCQAGGPEPAAPGAGGEAAGPGDGPSVGDADEFLVVDCLLPARVKRLGRQMTYLGPRRPVRTSAVDCEIRGGEYVAYDRADYRTALQVWLGPAEEGDAKAQTYVGEILERGVGGSPDYAAAAKWYRRAADQGHGPALINLGQLYEQGLGVEEDTALALNLYREAAGFDDAGLTYVASTDLAVETDGGRREADEGGETERLRQEIASLQDRLAELESQRQSASRTAADADAQRELEDAQAALEAERARLEEERVRADEAFAEIERQRREVEEERARLDAEERALEARREEAGDDRAARAEAERLLADLRERQLAFEEQSEALEARAAERAAREDEIAEREQALAAREADIRAREEALAEREQSVAARQAEVEELDDEIARLRDVVERQREELAAATAGGAGEDEVAVAGPSITLLDPQLASGGTRGPPVVRTRAGQSERRIVGKVEATAGVLSLSINDRAEELSEQGLFEETVPIGAGGSQVSIVAIDERGRRAALDFVLEPEEAGEEPVVAALDPDAEVQPAAAEVPPVDFGTFHALVIGNNEHAQLPILETAINDAEAVAGVLEDRYGFEVTLLRDATRYDILSALNHYRANLTEDDNLLVYYAGHGELDQANQRGHWLPVDAEADSTANWISNVAVTDILNAMSAQRVLVVADSCYSGALTRASLARLEAGMSGEARTAWLRAMASKRSRTALTSGGLAPTLDGGGGDHSVFAKVFLEVLRQNRGVIEGQRLFQEISARVTFAAQEFRFEQIPQYAPIKHAGHDAGEFFFVPGTA